MTAFSDAKADVFDFADSRSGENVRGFLGLGGQGGWKGKLVADDFSGHKACFEQGVTEVGCMAHARRKFHELWVHHGSQVGEQALKFFMRLYDFEREALAGTADERRRLRQRKPRRVAALALFWPNSVRGKGVLGLPPPPGWV